MWVKGIEEEWVKGPKGLGKVQGIEGGKDRVGVVVIFFLLPSSLPSFLVPLPV